VSLRRRLIASGLALSLAIAGLAASQPADPPKPPPLAAWIPAQDAALYLAIPDSGALRTQLQSDRVWNALQSVPAFNQLRERKDLRDLAAVAQVITAQLDTTPQKAIETLLGGRLELAVYGKERALIRLEPADPQFLNRAHAKILELARQDAASKGQPNPVREATTDGITTFHVGPKEAHAILDGTLIIASDDDLLTQVITRRASGKAEGCLAADALYSSRKAAAGDATAWGFANLPRLRQIDPNAFDFKKADAGAKFVFGPWIDAAQQADWLGLRLTWTGSHLGATVDLPTPPSGYAPALKGFLPPATGAGAPTPLDVPNLIASASLYRDLAAVWEARADLFPPEAQQGFNQLDSTAGTFFGGRDFATGVLGSLGANWRLVVALQDPSTLNPKPEVIAPAFALVAEVKPDDTDFSQRLQAAFQSFIGLVNLGAAQEKAPPLMLGIEPCEGLSITTSRFLAPTNPKPDEPVHARFNVSPSTVQVGNFYVLSSTLPLAKDLVKTLKSPAADIAKTLPATLVIDAKGARLADLISQNRERMIANNMLEKGNDRSQAETEIGVLETLVHYLGDGHLTVTDAPKSLELRLDFTLSETTPKEPRTK
jgi:hypothetical protein